MYTNNVKRELVACGWKECTGCGYLLETPDYSKCSTNWSGTQPRCRSCFKSYRDANADRLREYRRANQSRSSENYRSYKARVTQCCSAKGCDKKAISNAVGALCDMHYRRMQVHGELEYVNRRPRGESHHAWKGDGVSYTSAHERVMRLRGKASGHQCCDCEGQAAEWSYNHQGLVELSASFMWEGKLREVKYSGEPADYEPRCKSCHIKFDQKVSGFASA